MANSGDETAAIMIEIVQGEGGIHIVEQAFLDALKINVKNIGILLIIDEIQTGIGRTGKPFAFQHFDLNQILLQSQKG